MNLKQTNHLIRAGQIASFVGFACSVYAGFNDSSSLSYLKWALTGSLFLLNAYLASRCVSKPSVFLSYCFQILCLWLFMTMFLVPHSLGFAFTGLAYILAIVLAFAAAAGQLLLSHPME